MTILYTISQDFHCILWCFGALMCVSNCIGYTRKCSETPENVMKILRNCYIVYKMVKGLEMPYKSLLNPYISRFICSRVHLFPGGKADDQCKATRASKGVLRIRRGLGSCSVNPDFATYGLSTYGTTMFYFAPKARKNLVGVLERCVAVRRRLSIRTLSKPII